MINAIFLIVLGFDDLQTFEKYGGTVTCLPECEHFNYHFEVALGSLAKTIALNGHPFLLVFPIKTHCYSIFLYGIAVIKRLFVIFDVSCMFSSKDVKLENRSLVNVFFNDLVSTKYRRDVYLNWQNILGLFAFTFICYYSYLLHRGVP